MRGGQVCGESRGGGSIMTKLVCDHLARSNHQRPGLLQGMSQGCAGSHQQGLMFCAM